MWNEENKLWRVTLTSDMPSLCMSRPAEETFSATADSWPAGWWPSNVWLHFNRKYEPTYLAPLFWKVFEGHRSPIKMSGLQTSFLVIPLRNLLLHYESMAKHNRHRSTNTRLICWWHLDKETILIICDRDGQKLAHNNVSKLHHNVQHDTGSSSWQRASQKGQQMVFSLKNSRQSHNHRNYFWMFSSWSTRSSWHKPCSRRVFEGGRLETCMRMEPAIKLVVFSPWWVKECLDLHYFRFKAIYREKKPLL